MCARVRVAAIFDWIYLLQNFRRLEWDGYMTVSMDGIIYRRFCWQMNVEDWKRRSESDFCDHLELNFDEFGDEHWVSDVRF